MTADQSGRVLPDFRVPCPTCGAAPGAMCRDPKDGATTTRHPERKAGRVQSPLTKRRRKRWCYECQTFTLCHRYPTHLLEEQIDLCDRCAEEAV